MAGAYAYCNELKRIVTIDEARREYLSYDAPPGRFDFFCPDENCCQPSGNRTRITGANYTKSATEQTQYRTPYFRDWDEHHKNCIWEILRKHHQSIPASESSTARGKREARQKITDFIEIFNPNANQDSTSSLTSKDADDLIHNKKQHIRSNTEKQNEFKQYFGKTTSTVLERLVDTFIQIDHELGQDGLKALELSVTGVGVLSYREYFKPIRFANTQTTGRVLYGKATFIKPYGAGFLFGFYQRIDGMPITVYVSPKLVKEYRYKKHISDTVDDLAKAKEAGNKIGVTIYAIGRIEEHSKTLNLIVDDLRHFCIKLPPQANEAPLET
jgi:hypothetical protein